MTDLQQQLISKLTNNKDCYVIMLADYVTKPVKYVLRYEAGDVWYENVNAHTVESLLRKGILTRIEFDVIGLNNGKES